MVNDVFIMDQTKNKSFELNKDSSFSSIESDSIISDKKMKLNTIPSKSKASKEEREEEKRKKLEEKAKELEDKKKMKEERERIAEEKKKIKEERKKLWEEKKKEKEKEIEEKKKQLEEMKKLIEQKKAEKEAFLEAKKKEREEKKKLEEEEKIKKEEARLKKEEEKSKKQEERKRMEDEKLKKQKLISNKFVDFFQKIDPSSKPVNGFFESKKIASYIPTISKENFVLGAFDSVICHQDEKTLYLDELKNKSKIPYNFRKKQINDTEQFNDGIVLQNLNNEKKIYKAKLLQFQENNRPAYFGTWRKKSNLIKGKKPFEKDSDYFDYTIDSDDEWEEEERGESIKDSDSEQSGNEENDYELDDFFVPHGHLSDDENQDDELVDIQEMPNGQKKRKLLTKEKLLIEERTKKLKRLMPKAIGCLWLEPDQFCNKAKFMSFDKFKVVFIN